jgi:hypothetical protein
MHSSSPREAIRVAAATSDRFLRAADLDVPASAFAQAEHAGVIDRIVPGVYLGPGWPRQTLTDAAAWTLRHPNAVACLITAAVHHQLTDAFERGTWLLVPQGSSPPRSRASAVHVVQVAPWLVAPEDDEVNGIVRMNAHGVTVRVTGPDRTVLDLWRYPQLISGEHALVALRRRASTRGFNVPSFARLARRLGVWSKVEQVLQGMMVR